jgi:hypothetical protein
LTPTSTKILLEKSFLKRTFVSYLEPRKIKIGSEINLTFEELEYQKIRSLKTITTTTLQRVPIYDRNGRIIRYKQRQITTTTTICDYDTKLTLVNRYSTSTETSGIIGVWDKSTSQCPVGFTAGDNCFKRTTILDPVDPSCYQEQVCSVKNLGFTKTCSTYTRCWTNAYALNGKIGSGFYYNEVKTTKKTGLGALLGFIIGGFLFGVCGICAITGTTFSTVGALIGAGVGAILDQVKLNALSGILAVLTGNSFGTIESPSGGLQQFGWSWYGGFKFTEFILRPSGDIEVVPGGEGSNIIYVDLLKPPIATVTLSVVNINPNTYGFSGFSGLGGLGGFQNVQYNLPQGSTYTFEPQACAPNCSVNFTVKVPSSTRPGIYLVRIQGENEFNKSTSTEFKVKVLERPNYDFKIDSFDIRTFICKNKQFDTSFINDYLRINPNYQQIPSTTYATQFYNEVAKNTCPESQRNRPVEFEAKGSCQIINQQNQRNQSFQCPPSKLRIYIRPASSLPESEREVKIFESEYNNQYPKTVKGIYIFDKPYDYLVTAEFVDQNNRRIFDANPLNTYKDQTLRIFDYLCYFGFCSQNQRNLEDYNDLFKDIKYKTLNIFEKSDSPCRFYRNEICKAQIGF